MIVWSREPVQGQRTSLGTDWSLHFSTGIWLPSSRGDSKLQSYGCHATELLKKNWLNFAILGTWEQTIAWTSKVLQSENKHQKWKVTRASNTQHLGTSSKDTENTDAWCPQRKNLFESYYCYCLQDTESHKGALELAISLGCNFDARL